MARTTMRHEKLQMEHMQAALERGSALAFGFGVCLVGDAVHGENIDAQAGHRLSGVAVSKSAGTAGRLLPSMPNPQPIRLEGEVPTHISVWSIVTKTQCELPW